uniref:Uncharacterized protein n=1 Tax=Arundo donax TaxID=35708 RepID=A0A0A9B0T5_ARUDO
MRGSSPGLLVLYQILVTTMMMLMSSKDTDSRKLHKMIVFLLI